MYLWCTGVTSYDSCLALISGYLFANFLKHRDEVHRLDKRNPSLEQSAMLVVMKEVNTTAGVHQWCWLLLWKMGCGLQAPHELQNTINETCYITLDPGDVLWCQWTWQTLIRERNNLAVFFGCCNARIYQDMWECGLNNNHINGPMKIETVQIKAQTPSSARPSTMQYWLFC